MPRLRAKPDRPPADVLIYHDPECATSHEVIGLVRKCGIEPHVIEHLKIPPSRTLLRQLVGRMGIGARALMNIERSGSFERESNDAAEDDDAIIDAMVTNPNLIAAPIVVTFKGVRLCRPAELVLEILNVEMHSHGSYKRIRLASGLTELQQHVFDHLDQIVAYERPKKRGISYALHGTDQTLQVRALLRKGLIRFDEETPNGLLTSRPMKGPQDSDACLASDFATWWQEPTMPQSIKKLLMIAAQLITVPDLTSDAALNFLQIARAAKASGVGLADLQPGGKLYELISLTHLA